MQDRAGCALFTKMCSHRTARSSPALKMKWIFRTVLLLSGRQVWRPLRRSSQPDRQRCRRAYLPLAPARALQPEEFISFEVIGQGLWCYTAHILAASNLDDLPDQYGWRFLRVARARLTSARPLETGQIRRMRDAVLSTSRLTEQLTQAQAILRDPD